MTKCIWNCQNFADGNQNVKVMKYYCTWQNKLIKDKLLIIFVITFVE